MIKHLLLLLWNKKRENFLLGTEVLLAFLVLFGISIFVLNNYQKYSTPLGFNSKNLYTIPFSVDPEMDSVVFKETKERLLLAMKNLDGVETMSVGAWHPFSSTDLRTDTDINGYFQSANLFLADPMMAETMQLNLLEGEWFTQEDINGKYIPAVVNKRFVDEYYPGEKIVGKKIMWDNDEYHIKGVIGEYKYFGEFNESPRSMFLPFANSAKQYIHLYVRATDNHSINFEEKLDDAIYQAVGDWEYDIVDLEWMRKESSRSTWTFMMAMLCICGFLVFNVALGLFGVVWYNTSKRKGEIGLRRALGATTSGISRHFVGETMVMASVAILIGLFFAGQLPLLQVIDMEWKIYLQGMLIAALFIYTLVFVCSVVPSQQAAQIHPATALHEE